MDLFYFKKKTHFFCFFFDSEFTITIVKKRNHFSRIFYKKDSVHSFFFVSIRSFVCLFMMLASSFVLLFAPFIAFCYYYYHDDLFPSAQRERKALLCVLSTSLSLVAIVMNWSRVLRDPLSYDTYSHAANVFTCTFVSIDLVMQPGYGFFAKKNYTVAWRRDIVLHHIIVMMMFYCSEVTLFSAVVSFAEVMSVFPPFLQGTRGNSRSVTYWHSFP